VCSEDNGTGVVTVAEHVGEAKFEKLFMGGTQIGAFNILDIVAQVIVTLGLWVIPPWTLSETTIVAAPSTITFAPLEFVGRPKVSPRVDVGIASWQVVISGSVVIGNVVVHANAMSTAAVRAGRTSATSPGKTWEALAYAGLEVTRPTTTALAVGMLIVEGRACADRRIRREENAMRLTRGKAIGSTGERNCLGAQTLIASNTGIPFITHPFLLDGVELGIGDMKRFGSFGLCDMEILHNLHVGY